MAISTGRIVPQDRARPRKQELWFRCGKYYARTIKREDASDRWAGWVSDSWNVNTLNVRAKQLQKSDITDYIRRFDQRTSLLLGIFEKGTRLHIGIIRLDLDYAAKSAVVSALVGESNHRNRGATTDVFVPLLDFLFDTLGLDTVRASILQRNQMTLRYLLKMGWQIEEAPEAQIKSNSDGTMLGMRSVSWHREAYRAFRLTDLGSRILRRLSRDG